MHLRIDTKKNIYSILLLLAFTGLALRIYRIGQIDFWYDEMGLWIYSLTGEPSPHEPPLMAFLLYCLMWWIESADSFFIHFLPAILGSLTIPISFFISEKLDNNRVTGLIAAVLTTISPMAIYLSKQGRPYALFILISSSLYLSFIWAHKTNSRLSWLAYSFLLFLSCLSHLLTVQIVIALGIFSTITLITPELSENSFNFRIKRFANFLAFSLLGGVPGSLWIFQRQGIFTTIHGIYPHGLISYLHTFFIDLGPGANRRYWGDFSFALHEIFAVVYCVLFFAGLFRLYKKGKNELALLFVLALIIPFLINYFTLGVKGSWFWTRYISHTLLPFLVVVSVGLESITGFFKKRYIRVIILLFFIIAILPKSYDPLRLTEYTNYKKIALYLKDNADYLKGVIILPHDHNMGSVDRRIANIYYYHKREQLPVYHLDNCEVRKLLLMPSKGNITMISRTDKYPERNLESGKYAVLSRRPFKDCKEIPKCLKDIKATAKDSSPVRNGLTVCDIDFTR